MKFTGKVGKKESLGLNPGTLFVVTKCGWEMNDPENYIVELQDQKSWKKEMIVPAVRKEREE